MEQSRLIKVLIADDHPVIRFGIKHYLGQVSTISVVGEAENGQEAIHLAKSLQPDVLVLDLQMPVIDGIQVLATLHQEMPDLKILVHSVNDDRYLIADIIAMGAWGYYLKDEAPKHLVKAVQQAGRGEGKGRRPNRLHRSLAIEPS